MYLVQIIQKASYQAAAEECLKSRAVVTVGSLYADDTCCAVYAQIRDVANHIASLYSEHQARVERSRVAPGKILYMIALPLPTAIVYKQLVAWQCARVA